MGINKANGNTKYYDPYSELQYVKRNSGPAGGRVTESEMWELGKNVLHDLGKSSYKYSSDVGYLKDAWSHKASSQAGHASNDYQNAAKGAYYGETSYQGWNKNDLYNAWYNNGERSITNLGYYFTRDIGSASSGSYAAYIQNRDMGVMKAIERACNGNSTLLSELKNYEQAGQALVDGRKGY